MGQNGGGYLFRRPVKGKKAKTISCKNAHPDEHVAEMVYKKPDIRGVYLAEIVEKTSYTHVTDASVEGASVENKHVGTVNSDITLNKLFYRQGEKSDQWNSGTKN